MDDLLLVRCFRFRRIFASVFDFEALLSSQVAAVLEHVAAVGMQRPVGTFSRPLRTSRYLHEAIVERERMSNRVLPTLLILSIVRVSILNVLIDLRECAHTIGRTVDGMCDQGNVFESQEEKFTCRCGTAEERVDLQENGGFDAA